jgi:hypothetical protein
MDAFIGGARPIIDREADDRRVPGQRAVAVRVIGPVVGRAKRRVVDCQEPLGLERLLADVRRDALFGQRNRRHLLLGGRVGPATPGRVAGDTARGGSDGSNREKLASLHVRSGRIVTD